MARKTEVRYVNFYLAGSAAYQFDPQPIRQKKEVKLPKPKRQSQKKIVVHVDPVATFGICMAVVLLVCIAVGLFQLGAARRQADEMQSYVNTLSQRNEELCATYKQGYDPEEIYQIATAMGMIPAEQAQRIQIPAAAEQTTEEPGMWESFRTFLAGLFA
ncbi:MAG: hypothetical protein J6L24_05455 [Oscillospiraceae bacterium]|nr:hypothetical protein [Oscillospiraceae bacterium]